MGQIYEFNKRIILTIKFEEIQSSQIYKNTEESIDNDFNKDQRCNR